MPAIGKLLEKFIYNRKISYFTKFELLKKNQFSFGSCRGTVDALVSLIKSIRQRFKNQTKLTQQLAPQQLEKSIRHRRSLTPVEKMRVLWTKRTNCSVIKVLFES